MDEAQIPSLGQSGRVIDKSSGIGCHGGGYGKERRSQVVERCEVLLSFGVWIDRIVIHLCLPIRKVGIPVDEGGSGINASSEALLVVAGAVSHLCRCRESHINIIQNKSASDWI
jgi:hypothetical protein